MSPANPRKRAAPGASPVVQAPQMPQSYTAPSQVSNADFLRWNQAPENASFGDNSGYNMNTFGGNNGLPQPSFDQSVPTPSTQLARRPMNRQLVPQNGAYGNSTDPWGQFSDESILDPTAANGTMEEDDNIELLEERATVAKRDAQSKRKQIPPFVQKLSSFLDDGKNTELIRWSDRGDSFVVLDEDEFAKTLIPELFKHNNYASFVRQLNMYGFHKRVGLSDNSMKASERKNKSPSEYCNRYFRRGHPNLLWLINKPKGGTTKSKKARTKNDERQEDSDNDDDVEEVYGNHVQAPRAISAAPESGPLQRRDMAALQKQLADIQNRQGTITDALTRLRREHNQLFQQSMAFQTLHDRHENSINAILTFLATVYNRSLDGQGPQNIAQMFANGIPNDQQNQGSVVDIGDISDKQHQTPGNMSPLRRQQRLLMAPPTTGRASTATPSAAGTPLPQEYTSTPQSGAIEELFDTTPSDSTQIPDQPRSRAQGGSQNMRQPVSMMQVIQNTNAQARPNNNTMEFPEMLSHFENSNGNSPLTNEERNNMLSLIANTSSAPGTNNALVSPSPPSLLDLGYTQQDIEALSRLQAEQDTNLEDVKNALEVHSPSGSIPGLDSNFFNSEISDPNASNLDLDQYLDTGAFYNGSSPVPGTDYSFDNFGDGMGDADVTSHFDVGMDGTVTQGQGRVPRSPSQTPTPTSENKMDLNLNREESRSPRSPGKRRRRN